MGPRSRPAQRTVSQRYKANVALPRSMIRAEESMSMRVDHWISLAGLVVSVIGFSVATGSQVLSDIWA